MGYLSIDSHGILAEVKLFSNPNPSIACLDYEHQKTIELTLPRLSKGDLVSIACSVSNERVLSFTAFAKRHKWLALQLLVSLGLLTLSLHNWFSLQIFSSNKHRNHILRVRTQCFRTLWLGRISQGWPRILGEPEL